MEAIKRFFHKLFLKWDPRSDIAKTFFSLAEAYPQKLCSHPNVKPDIAEKILGERSWIGQLFLEKLPEYSGETSVVVTADTQVESCSIFLWEGHLYILVSALLLGRPIDISHEDTRNFWKWLVVHESQHVRRGHLSILFYARRLFKTMSWVFAIAGMGKRLSLLDSSWVFWTGAVFGFTWFVQLATGWFCELQADFDASQAIDDPQVLKDAEDGLDRMVHQAIHRTWQPFGWVQYMYSNLFLDPHPPMVLRRWILRRRAAALKLTHP